MYISFINLILELFVVVSNLIKFEQVSHGPRPEVSAQCQLKTTCRHIVSRFLATNIFELLLIDISMFTVYRNRGEATATG